MKNDIALVTGAARRIGRDVAIKLSRAGFAIAAHFHSSKPEADELIRQIRSEGGEAKAFGGDLRDWDFAAGLVEQVCAEFGRPNLLVNSAALFLDDRAENFQRATWRAQFAVNLEAPVLLAQSFARALPSDETGAIVNIVDQRVLRLTPQNFSYTLAKAALWTATQTLAQALAPRICVNAVGPGPTYPSVRQGRTGLNVESANVPLEKAVTGAEIAEAALYLARAKSVTGVMLCVDGGQHLAWRTPDIVE